MRISKQKEAGRVLFWGVVIILVILVRRLMLKADQRGLLRQFWLLGVWLSAMSILVLAKIATFLLDLGFSSFWPWDQLLNLFSLLPVLIFYFYNQHLWSLFVFVLGVASNAAVILFNGGQMPISRWAWNIAGGHHEHNLGGFYVFINEKTRLALLGDIIPVIDGVASVGDCLVLFFLILIYWQLRTRLNKGA